MSDNNQNDNQYEGFEEEPQPEEVDQVVKPAGNRSFLLAIGIIAGVSLLALIVMVVIALVVIPSGKTSTLRAQGAEINAANTATSQAATLAAATAQAKALIPPTFTPTAVPPSPTPVVAIATPTLTETPVVVVVTEAPGEPLADMFARTQTLAALQTLSAGGPVTEPAIATPTELSKTGFFNEVVSLPVLAAMTALLFIVIFVVRRLRSSQ